MFVTSAPSTVNKVPPQVGQFASNPVTPSDSEDLPLGPNGATCRALRVTGAGDINVNLYGGGTAVLTTIGAGQVVLVACTRVLSTSTTATGIEALYG